MSAAVARAEATCSPWMTTARQSLATVAETALGTAIACFEASVPEATAAVSAYVPVMTPGNALQIGIVADPESCATLARALLQLEPGDDLSAGDIADAIGEIANMVAGATKAAMATSIGVVALGLPMIIHGWVVPSDQTAVECARTSIGGATVNVVVLQSHQSS